MLSDIAYEKLIGIVGLSLSIPEQYLGEFDIFFELNEIYASCKFSLLIFDIYILI